MFTKSNIAAAITAKMRAMARLNQNEEFNVPNFAPVNTTTNPSSP